MPDQKRTRSRSLKGPVFKGLYKQTLISTGQTTIATRNTAKGFGKQVTVSEGHHWPPSKKTADLSDYGGDFYTTKSYIESANSKWVALENIVGGFLRVNSSGNMLPADPNSLPWPSGGESSDSTLDALGATAIARCAPGNPVASATTALGEVFKDGLPHLVGHAGWQNRTNSAKAGGEEYLNAQFGWVPLLSDITDFSQGVVHFNSIASQFERDAGKVVRRRYNFPQHVEESVVTVDTAAKPYLPVTIDSALLSNTGKLVRIEEIRRKQWFSGAFTYYLPSGYDSRNAVRRLTSRADAILGLSLSPETLWELAPWSWAADWFSNAGDVIHNVSRFESGGLIMRYGYMMEHSIVKHSYILDPVGLKNPYGGIKLAPLVLVTETKKRRKANPFGFGVSWEGLSAFQASILGALGITRLIK